MANKTVDYEAVLLAISYVETMLNGDAEQHEVISTAIDQETLIHGLTAVSIIFMEITRNKLNLSRLDLIETARMLALQELTSRDTE